jgi:hypothetical protein
MVSRVKVVSPNAGPVASRLPGHSSPGRPGAQNAEAAGAAEHELPNSGTAAVANTEAAGAGGREVRTSLPQR